MSSGGTDENRVLRPYNDEHSGVFESFVSSQSSLNPSLHSMVAKAELQLGGVPLSEHKPSWNGTSAHSDASNSFVRALRQKMAIHTNIKRFMGSELGFLGLMPASVAVGDVLIILVGPGQPIMVFPGAE